MAPSARFTEDFAYEVLSVVGEIPEGTVATYGQIARLIGRDKNSRLVARVLSHASNYGDFPCHRVVNHAGRLVPRLAGTGISAATGRRGAEGRDARGPQEISMGMLIFDCQHSHFSFLVFRAAIPASLKLYRQRSC